MIVYVCMCVYYYLDDCEAARPKRERERGRDDDEHQSIRFLAMVVSVVVTG